MNLLRKIRLKQHIIRAIFKGYYYDAQRFYKYCTETELSEYTENRLIGYIITKYHVVEKGLTMPEMRLGFGTDAVRALMLACEIYLKKFKKQNVQVEHGINVLYEYLDVHKENQFSLDANIIERITNLKNKTPKNCDLKNQTKKTEAEYFLKKNAPFPDFAKSRHSLRNFSEKEIRVENLNEAIKLAQDTTPTSCNRQSIRIHLVSDKEKINQVLGIQTGNRGFGHLTNKLIIISSEVSVYNEVRERNLPYVDAGIYSMNLLYALHFYEIGACALNWSAYNEADEKLHHLINIPDSEAICLIIICGKPAPEFNLAVSKRFDVESIAKYQ